MPPMKISGVDRCGCLIQSARLESSDLHHHRRQHRCCRSSSRRRFQPPFRFAFNPLSQSDVTRAQANPIRSKRVPILYLSLIPLSFSLSLLIFFYSFYRSLSGFLSLSLPLSVPSSFSLIFFPCPGLPSPYDFVPLTRISPKGKIRYRGVQLSVPRGVSTFYSHLLTDTSPPAISSFAPAQRFILNKLEIGTLESAFGKLT